MDNGFAPQNEMPMKGDLLVHPRFQGGLQSVWNKFLDKFPKFRGLLQNLSKNRVGFNLGGLYHRGKSTYTVEAVGCCYLFLFVFFIISNFLILLPAIRGDVARVATDFS
mmetsp:Transcript_36020/g.55319  ORF Transcript_36020/g.55319 Transcript_36020/m.55319 type:complete len:109 (-) Transcript_36020:852-1178(-)